MPIKFILQPRWQCHLVLLQCARFTYATDRDTSAAGVSDAAGRWGTKRRSWNILAGMESGTAGVIWFCFGTSHKQSLCEEEADSMTHAPAGPRQLEVTAFGCFLDPAAGLITPDPIYNILRCKVGKSHWLLTGLKNVTNIGGESREIDWWIDLTFH